MERNPNPVVPIDCTTVPDPTLVDAPNPPPYCRADAVRSFLRRQNRPCKVKEIALWLACNGDGAGGRSGFGQVVGSLMREMLIRGSVVRVSRGLYALPDAANLTEAG